VYFFLVLFGFFPVFRLTGTKKLKQGASALGMTTRYCGMVLQVKSSVLPFY
jgi:hypothetical protein